MSGEGQCNDEYTRLQRKLHQNPENVSLETRFQPKTGLDTEIQKSKNPAKYRGRQNRAYTQNVS